MVAVLGGEQKKLLKYELHTKHTEWERHRSSSSSYIQKALEGSHLRIHDRLPDRAISYKPVKRSRGRCQDEVKVMKTNRLGTYEEVQTR
jgi:hypothetical protein